MHDHDHAARRFDARATSSGVTAGDVAASIGAGLAKAALGGEGRRRAGTTSTARSTHDAAVAIVTPDSDDGREVLRHSTAHVMAQAVTDLFPGAKYAIGPAIADGFYYDFELPDGAHFTDDDLGRIEARMREIVKADEPFVREELDREHAIAHFADQPYKIEIIERVDPDDAGEIGDGHDDLGVPQPARRRRASASSSTCAAARTCRRPSGSARSSSPRSPARTGGATRSARCCSASTAPRGSRRPRSRSTCTGSRRPRSATTASSAPSSTSSRSPRRSAPGLAVFHPKGGTIRRVMEDYSRRRHEEAGYEFVNSPHITKSHLFEISGHLDWFADGMYPPMELDGGTDYYLKPMNCPFHILIYRSRMRSYRELPLRLFEFGTVYRYEKSGVVHGLTRVRGMTQDDAHIFCTREQIVPELQRALEFVLGLLRDYGLDDFYLELSTKPRGQGGRHRRGVGRGHRGAAHGRRGRRPRARDGRGRRRVLRPEDLGAGARTPSAARGRCRRSSSTSSCRSASSSSTSAPTTSATGRS